MSNKQSALSVKYIYMVVHFIYVYIYICGCTLNIYIYIHIHICMYVCALNLRHFAYIYIYMLYTSYVCVCTLNPRHFAYGTSRTTCICTLTLSTLLVEHIISSIWISRITTRSRWKFRIRTITNDLTLYSFSSLHIFVTWGWPTLAEICQPNKTDTKTVVFWCTYPLLIRTSPPTLAGRRSFNFKHTSHVTVRVLLVIGYSHWSAATSYSMVPVSFLGGKAAVAWSWPPTPI
jgi:hypothetical protein